MPPCPSSRSMRYRSTSAAVRAARAVATGLRPLQQLLEPRIALERREIRVDPDVRRRQHVWDLHQLLQHIERLSVLADQQVDAQQLVLVVGASDLVLAERVETCPPSGLRDRLGLAPQRRQSQTQEEV